ncbi:MAG: caspase family protein [Bacillota bacterium]
MAGLRKRNTALFLSALLFFFTILSFITIGALLPAQVAYAANPVVFRGLFVGCGNYEGEDFDLAPSTNNDANECCYVFSNAYYDGVSRVKGKMSIATDIRKSKLISCLNPSSSGSIFYGADSNDVSVFYFSGHGTDYDENGRTAIVLSDGAVDELMSVDALEAALHKIPGIKVVILDSCFSGGMIGRSYSTSKQSVTISKSAATSTPAPTATATPAAMAAPCATVDANATTVPSSTVEPAPAATATIAPSAAPAPIQTAPPDAHEAPTMAEQAAFAQALIGPFKQANQEMRALLSQPEYIVFTASSGDDYSYGESEGADAMGCFTRSFTDGLGRLGHYVADGNNNKYITVKEAYSSALKLFSTYYGDELGESTAQVYPKNSTFPLLRYTKNGACATGKATQKNTAVYSSTVAAKTALRSLAPGTSVNIYGVLGNYYKVSVGDTFGYVYKSYVNITSGSVGTPVLGVGKAKTVTYIYSSTSTSGAKLRKLSAGSMMDIMGVSGSYYIVSSGGIAGCVPASAVTVVSGSVGPQPASPYVLATGKATAQTCVYSNHYVTSNKLRTLNVGNTMTITAALPAFYKVWVSGIIGYVPRSCVSIVSGTLNGSTPKSVNTSVNTQGEAKALCYVTSTIYSTAKNLYTLKTGNRITLLSVKGSHYKVLKNGKTGYVRTASVKVLSSKALSAAGQAKETCYIYASRSTASEKILTLDTGACVSIRGVYGSYYTVTVSGVSGYIPVKSISVL